VDLTSRLPAEGPAISAERIVPVFRLSTRPLPQTPAGPYSLGVLRAVASTLIVWVAAAAPFAAHAACTDGAAPAVDWRRCAFYGAELRKENLSGANLRDAAFDLARLEGADLSKAEAYRAKFVGAKLAGAQLDGAVLGEADFTRADLTDASLVGADLRRARFFRATLKGADLSRARLAGADLLGADLSGALWTDGKRRCGDNSIGQCN
jgi:uncharacterized protein YjbI with pentapeptide repeats